MDRNTALTLLNKYISKPQMLKHSLASEAVLKAIAKKIGANEETYALAGLLHDLDSELSDAKTHGLKTIELLNEFCIDTEILEAITLHNEEATTAPRTKTFHHALACGETITGLITATALVYPDKKLSSVKLKSITKRMKEKAFAESVNRNTILECEKIGISLEDFCQLSLSAMQNISEELGL